MDRALKRFVTLNAWLVFLHYFTSSGMSIRAERFGSKTSNSDNNPGFISIDCGANNDYLDGETGISYQTDRDFVDTGTNQVVSPAAEDDLNYPYFGRQLKTLRSFPVGTRNCYTLKPKQGKNTSYLIRAFFSYGNYDGKNQTPAFNLYIGVNYWSTVGLDRYYQFKELIHTPLTDTIEVCLVKTGPTIPYISSLELRPLNTSIYQISFTSQFLLHHVARLDVGAPNEPLHSRYKDDIYDRVWRSYGADGWYPFNSSVNIDSGEPQDAYALPVQVLRTAAESGNVSYALNFDFDTAFEALERSFKYCVYFHFAEIKKLLPGKKRVIEISLNGENILSEPLILEYLKPITISPKNATQGYVRFSISATSESDAPPVLNAFEVYKLETELASPTDTTDADAIMDIRNKYSISRLNWQGDPCVPNQYAWDGLICNSDINPRITSLNLSSTKLTGKIDTSFSYLTELVSLDLSYNDFTGPLPEFLAELPKLKILNLSGNKLSGTIPKALREKAEANNLQLSLNDNPGLCITNSCEKRNFIVPLVASISALIAVLSISIGIWIFKRRKQVPKVVNKLSHFSNFNKRRQSKKQQFTYVEVLRITNNFERVVGKGGFGVVYHGYLGNTQVAVKVLSPSVQGYLQFQREAELLTMIHHKCLIALIGYCDEGTNLALIYEYMANGDLAEHLSDKNEHIIGWKQRLQIAIHAAEGLEYLHNGCKPPIIHRDVKSRNILLNEKFQGKLADFGLSKIFADEDDTHVYTMIAGTPGYLDPEYSRSNKLTEKSDVYSFGVVLLEIITGEPAISKTKERIHIVKWVESMLPSGDIDDIMDSRLQGEYDTDSARKALYTTMMCVAPSSTNRPTMSLVVRELKQCLPIETVMPSDLLQGPSYSSIDISFDRISGESSLAR